MTHHPRLSRAFSLLVLFVLVFTSFSTTHAQDGGPGDATATPAAPAVETPVVTATPETEVTVVPDAPTDAVIFSIAGKVTGKDGKGLAGVDISDDQSHAVLTGADGTYALGGLKAGTYLVRAKLAGVDLIPFYRVVKLVDKDVSGIDFYPPKNTIQPRNAPGTQVHPNYPAPAAPQQPGEVGAQAIYKVDKPGTVYRYVDEFGTPGEQYNPQPVDSITYLNEPVGVAIDGEGKLLVVEEVGDRLVRFTADGESDLAIGRPGVSNVEDYAFNDLLGVAVDPAGHIWVLDNSRVVEYDPTQTDEQFVQEFPAEDNSPWETGSGIDRFKNPHGIAFNDTGGEMYIADTDNQRVQVFTFDEQGKPQWDRTLGVTGEAGSDGYHFNNPWKLTFYKDDLYVSDSWNATIQRCPGAATPCETWLGVPGETGNDFTHLSTPQAVAFDAAYAYVLDTANARVLRCEVDGTDCQHFAGVAGEFGDGDDQLNWTTDITVGPDGKIYVDDAANNRIEIFDSSGTLVGRRGTTNVAYEIDDHHLNDPRGLAVAPDGSVYVAEERNYTVAKLNPAGVVQWRYGQSGSEGVTSDLDHMGTWGGVNGPVGPVGNMAIDSQGRLYVADAGRDHIAILLPGGQLYNFLGQGSGTGNYQFNWPHAVAISPSNGDIYVADTANQRIQVFNSARTYKATLGVTDVTGSDSRHFNYPRGVAVDSSGNIFVADSDNQRVQKCKLGGTGGYTCVPFAGQTGMGGSDFRNLNGPTAIAVGPDGQVFVVDTWQNRVQVFGPDGAYRTTIGGDWGEGSGNLQTPNGVAVDSSGNVYVADSWNARVVKYAPGVPGWSQLNVNGWGEQWNRRANGLAVFTPTGGQPMLYVSNAVPGKQNPGISPSVRRLMPDGTWQTVSAPGFGSPNVNHIETLFVNGDYLYASTWMYSGASQIWRCSADSGCDAQADWENVSPPLDDTDIGIVPFAVYQGQMYVGVSNFDGVSTTGASIWVYDGTSWTPSWTLDASNTKTDPIIDVHSLFVFDDGSGAKLYAGTFDWLGTPAQLWEFDGTNWTMRKGEGIDNLDNHAFTSMAEFNHRLYVGTWNVNGGAMLYRYGADWDTDEVVVPDGFGDSNNDAIRALTVKDGYLYAVTENHATGVQIWRSSTGDRDVTPGSSWEKYLAYDGFGSSLNATVNASTSVLSWNNRLYVGTWNDINGGQVWASDPISTYSISGATSPAVAGVTVTLNPGGLTASTDSSGIFTFSGVFPGTYTLTPTKAAYAFTPVSQPAVVGAADVSGITFTALTGPITLLRPADGTKYDTLLPVTLAWAKLSGVTQYTLQICTDNLCKNIWKSVTQAGVTYTASGLAAKTKYFWHVRKAAPTPGTWSAMWSFTTPWPALAPLQLRPTDKSALSLHDFSPDFTWKAAVVPGGGRPVQKYHLQISQSSTFTGLDLDEYTLGAGTAYTPPADLTPNRLYYWHIRAINTAGEFSAWSSTFSFKVLPAEIWADGIENQETIQPTFHWHDDWNVGKYTIQICKVSGSTCSLFLSASSTKTSYTLTTAPTGGANYRWRVQAAGTTGAGPWTGYWDWKAPTPPAIPTLSLPIVNAIIPGANSSNYKPTFTWKSLGANIRYQIQIAKASVFNNDTIFINGNSDTGTAAYTLQGDWLWRNSAYWWRVRACDGDGDCSLWSGGRKLITKPESPFHLDQYPIDNTLDYAFEWEDNPNNSAASYTIQLCSSDTCPATSVIKSAPAASPYYHLLLGAGKHYWWRVNGIGSASTSNWSNIQDFWTISPAPVPSLSLPLNNAATGYAVNFAWTLASGPAADGFHIQVSKFSDYSTLAAEDSGLDLPAYSHTFTGGTYYWRVRSSNPDGWSQWSASRKFLTPAEVAGYIVKTDGTPIANAAVSLSGVAAPITTGDDGWYDFKNAPTGARSLSVSAATFMPQTRSLSLANGGYYRNDFGLVVPENFFTIQLTWADKPNYPDLDAHLWLPDGTHLSWQNPGPIKDAAIDFHDGTPARLETAWIKNVVDGIYTFGVYQWSPTVSALTGSGASVKVYFGASTPTITCAVPTSGTGSWWQVFTITITNGGKNMSLVCKNKIQATPPKPVEATAYKESPALASLVKAGKLPAVDQRVSKNPQVITPRESVGSYGGTLKTFSPWNDISNALLYIVDPPIKWKDDLSGYQANLADRWSWSADGKTFSMHLREGVKWSDGTPYTTEDWRFWWQDMATNPAYPAANLPDWLRQSDGSPVVMEFPDQFTVVWKSDKPLWVTPFYMAQGYWSFGDVMKPASYLKKFHPKYTPGKTYADLQKADNWSLTPGYPTVFAWYCASVSKDGKLVTFARNPYFWKVDSAGHQLPYIDKFSVAVVTDTPTQLLNTSLGMYDTLFVSPFTRLDIPFLQTHQVSGNYTMLSNFMQGTGGDITYVVNQDYVAGGGNYADDSDDMAVQIRDVLRDKRFRQALSLGIDRTNVINTVWNGNGTPQQATLSPQSPLFAGSVGQTLLHAWQQAYATQDVATANNNLDLMGMTTGEDGLRTLPGTHDPFVLVVDNVDGSSGLYLKTAKEVAKEWRDNLHIHVEVKDYSNNAGDANQRKSKGWSMIQSKAMSELDLWTYPDWLFAVKNAGAFPLEGLWYLTGGSGGEEPLAGSPGQRLQTFYDQGMATPDGNARIDIARQAIQDVLIDEGPFYIGIYGDFAMPAIAKNYVHNVLNFGVLGPWAPEVPGNQDPSEWWMDAH
jgi:ABC-type transport system substrate-binding protein/DNA-binding beta-propeller fold protein YncE